QISGPNLLGNRDFATNLLDQLRVVPGAADLRIHQVFDQPKLHIYVDRTKAEESGFTQRDVATNMLVSLSGSFQTTPSYWLDPRTGVTYNVVTQAPQFTLSSIRDLENIPITGDHATRPEILGDVASTSRGAGMAVVSHYDIQRVIDIFGTV